MTKQNWIQTLSGKAFFPHQPDAQLVDIKEIAHSLSMQCRYIGHVRKFYSVAEHSVLVSQSVSPENALWALLHDATETYVGDRVTPLKTTADRQLEGKIEIAIAEAFGLTLPMPKQVKQIDVAICLNERSALLSKSPLPWPADSFAPVPGITIKSWPPGKAYRKFMLRWYQLTQGSPNWVPDAIVSFWRIAKYKLYLPPIG